MQVVVSNKRKPPKVGISPGDVDVLGVDLFRNEVCDSVMVCDDAITSFENEKGWVLAIHWVLLTFGMLGGPGCPNIFESSFLFGEDFQV